MQHPKKPLMQSISDYFDLRGFSVSVVLVIAYGIAVLFPFILATPGMFRNLSLAAGGFPLESFTELPGYGSPMRLQVLPVAAGLPELAQIMDFIVYYGFLLTFSTVLIMGLMFMQKREKNRSIYYMRRLLFMTMILMLFVHLLGPRGVYKYYFTLFAPFFSIFASSKMVTSENESVPFSFSMLWLPILLSLSIIIPPRTVYLFCVILIILGYILAPQIGTFWRLLNSPGGWVMKNIKARGEPVSKRLLAIRNSRGPSQSKTFTLGGQEIRIEFIGALDQIFRKIKVLQSRVIINNEIVSENSARIWSEDEEPLSSLTHEIELEIDGSKVPLRIEHLSSIYLGTRVTLDGEIIVH